MSEIEGFIENQATRIVGIVVERIRYEISLGWNLTGALEKLRDELTQIASLLAGASNKPITNKVLLSWLTKIGNIVYDAEDLLDEWSYEELGRKIKIKRRGGKRLWDESRHLVIRQGTAHKVDDLLTSITGLYDEATKRGINLVEVADGKVYDCSSSPTRRRQQQRLINQRRYVEEECVYGREKDLAEIMKLLKGASNSQEKLNVIGIVGMAGSGKTTLSIQASKAEEVRRLFDPNMVNSVVVSHEDGSTDAIMKKIAKKVLKKEVSDEIITSELEEKLGKKKYLLILDDVWDTTSWNDLSNALLQIGGSKGTTILVTSRERQVVEKMNTPGNPQIHPLGGLSEADSWSLFTKRITDDNLRVPEKYEIASKMIKKCGGIPLAIKLLGDLLRNNSELYKWREFEKSKQWTKNDESNILHSLKLSYIHLKTPLLKSCFSYCAIFREDEEISKNQLIELWMAHGLLEKRECAEMEVVGEECFNDLLNCSLFHEPQFDVSGDVMSVKMHDLIRDLACDISKRNNEGGASGGGGGGGGGGGVRHLSVSTAEDALYLSDCKMLRTCLIADNILSLNNLQNFEKLRALSFRIFSGPKRNYDWKSLGNLKHLRYLQVRFHCDKGRDKLLSQIAELYHLQTLHLVFGSGLNISSLKDELPKNFTDLVNLRHLFIDANVTAIGIIVGLSHFTNLQTLPPIDLKEDWGGKISELQNLDKLRDRLEISNINQIQNKEAAQSVNMGAKSSLKALELRDICNPDSRHANEILEALQPHRNLIDLSIQKFTGTRFPMWLTSTGSLSNLVKLKLVTCGMVTGELNMGIFKSLRSLFLFGCDKLTVVFPEDGFECCKLLEELHIENCYQVHSLPNLSPLTRLDILTIFNIGIAPDQATRKLEGMDYLRCSQVQTHGVLLPETLSQDSSICKSLKTLLLMPFKYGNYNDDVETIPLQLQHFVALQKLVVTGHRGLETLPDWLANMTSLEYLKLYDLQQLQHLPSTFTCDRPSKLKKISIKRCPKLRRYHPSMEVDEKWTKKIRFLD